MFRSTWVRGIIAAGAFFVCGQALATSYTSFQTGNWNSAATWSPSGVPGIGDDVTITANHTVTVNDARTVLSVTFDSTSGNKVLLIDSSGSLLVESAAPPAVTINPPAVASTSTLFIDGGTLDLSNAGILIDSGSNGGAIATLSFSALGGTANIAGNVSFSGNPSNARIDFNVANGALNIGGDLSPGGAIFVNPNTNITFNGTSSQTIGGNYTLQSVTINKPSGTATLAGPLTVNGTLAVTSAILDDGGFQISLDGGGTSSVTMGANGVLKLGSESSATWFPTPVNPANVTLAPGSAVVYQSGTAQTIDDSIAYKRLYLQRIGTAAGVWKSISNSLLKVIEELNIGDDIVADFDNDILDVDGDINSSASGVVQLRATVVAADAFVGGNWNGGTLSAANGTLVTYDGAGPQNILPATYSELTIASPSATTSGNVIVNSSVTLSGGNVAIGGSFFIDVNATVWRSLDQYFIGPLTMGLNPSPARQFHVGTATAYLPVDVDAGSAGTVTIEAVEGDHPNRTGDNVLDRYWRIVAPSTVTPIEDLTFHYNTGDVTTGDETKFILAQYNAGWTRHGDVNDGANSANITNVSSYLSDWVIGQKGSLGTAGKLGFVSINGGSSPTANVPFDVDVESQHDDGTTANVPVNTTVDILLAAGSGSLMTSSGTINAGTSSANITNLTYDTAEATVQLEAQAVAGEMLDPATSNVFAVSAAPSTLTVTSLGDSGAGTLRDAIEAHNAGGCTQPCVIEFSTSGDIVLNTPLPAITQPNLTINGYSAPGASLNTNAIGQPSNAVIVMSINGINGIDTGFDIQETFVKIKGFAIMNFLNGGTGAGVRFSGDNSGSTVYGCYIGLNTTGEIAAPNAHGVIFEGSTESSLGGSLPEHRNVISGNTVVGVAVADDLGGFARKHRGIRSEGIAAESGSNTISINGNYIGVKADLSGAIANDRGISVCASCTSVSIGGSAVGNIISGNTTQGVLLSGSGATLLSNRIGVIEGATILANGGGVEIADGANFNTIGGPSPSDVNTISGSSGGAGLYILGDDNTVDNNHIGIAVDGVTIAGNVTGVTLGTGAERNLIGTTSGNKIANNLADGIMLNAAAGIGNTFRKNKIYQNAHHGIDIDDDGTTANDATDADLGANNKQNVPMLAAAQLGGGLVEVTLSLNSSSGVATNFFIFDLYRADTATANHQANLYLGGSGCLAGNVFTNQVVGAPAGIAAVGDRVVATATAYSDASCNTPSEGTSELSASVVINGPIHWNNAAGGAWETPANWNPAVVPTAGDFAIIDLSGTYTVTINAPASVDKLQVGGGAGTQTLNVTLGNALNIANPSDVITGGKLTLDGNLSGNGSLDVTGGQLVWNGGTISGVAALNINSSSSLEIATAMTHTLSQRLLTIASGASATWTGGAITLQTGGGIDNAGTFTIQTDANISDGAGDAGFDNTGTLTKNTTAGATQFVGVDFTHTAGSLDVQTGFLNFSIASINAPVTIASGAELTVDSDVVTTGNAATFSGSGSVRVTGGTLTVNSTTLTLPHLKLDGGVVNGTGVLGTGATGVIDWTGGAFAGSGSTLIENGGTMNVTGVGAKLLDQRSLTINSGGDVSFGGTGALTLLNGATITNGGDFEHTSDASITNGVGGGTFTNLDTGAIQKTSAGTSTMTVPLTANALGLIEVQSGAFNPSSFTNNAMLSIDGTLVVDDSTTTLGTGTVFIGGGTVHVNGGTFTVDENLTIPNIDLDSGIFNGTGAVAINTSMDWSGGSLEGTGSTTIDGTGALNITGPSLKTMTNRALSIAGSASATMSGSGISLQTGASIANSGIFLTTADGSFINTGGAGAFTNNAGGTFRKTTSTNPTVFTGLAFNNAGTVDLQSGSLDLAGGTNSGTLTLGASTTLLINSDSYTFAAGTTASGAGIVSVQSGGFLTVSSAVTLPKFELSGGTLDGTGTLTIGTAGQWNGGIMQSLGTTEVGSTATLTIGGASPKTLIARTLSVASGGLVNWIGNGTITVQSGGNVANSGVFTVTTDGAFSNGGAAGSFVNNGVFRKHTSTGTTSLGIPFNNSGGMLDAQTGIISFNGFQQPSGTTKIQLGGLTPGTQFAQLQFASGTPSFAGTLEITLFGAYEPNPGDTFRVLSIPGGAHTGDFTQPYTYPALTGGKTFSDAYDALGLLLSVAGLGDLAISKSAPPSVVISAPISYTIGVNNLGPDPANGITVTDTLPAGHTSINASGTGWSCNVVADTVTCTRATLAVGAAPNITINANAPSTPQSFTNTATVTASNDPSAGNNSANAGVTVDPIQADLELSAFSPVGAVAQSTPFQFDFHVKNNGPQTATSVAFTAPIPSTLTYNSATPTSGSCSFSAGTVSCNLGNILNSNTVTVTINLSTTTTAGTHSVTGSATATESEPTPGNNNIAASVTVSGNNFIVTNVDDVGDGSLRQALLDAASPACATPCTISFNIISTPPFVITPTTVLPSIGNDTVLDATTQPGYTSTPLIEIDGTSAPTGSGTLRITGNNSRIKGLSITNGNTGVAIDGNNNFLEASYVGLTPAGTNGANENGVIVTGNTNVIGGNTATVRNVISGNNDHGIQIVGAATGNTIAGNYIGTDPTGTLTRPNNTGVELLDEAAQTTIGGLTAAHRNLISGNNSYGIYIQGQGSVVARGVSTEVADHVDQTTIKNNWIGPDASGTNALGATIAGIVLNQYAANTVIGGSSEGNVISGNGNGIMIGSDVFATTMQWNLIGVAPDGTTPMPNSQSGISLLASNGSKIEGNTIANNGGDGISMLGNLQNAFSVNSIFNNGNMGIDLAGDGVTANDADDSDGGPNGRQNFPTITSASLTGGNLVVNYTLDSSGSTASSILVEIFEADSVASGQGKTSLGTVCIASNSFASGTTLPAPTVSNGDPIVATATSYSDTGCTTVDDGTSEFSPVVTATTCVPPAVTINAPATVCANSTGNSATATAPTATSFTWNITNGTITAGQGTPSITFTAGATGSVILQVDVVDNLGCPGFSNATPTIVPAPTVNITGPTTACDSAVLDAGPGFASYLWNTGATTQTVTVTTSNTYSVTVTNGSGCTANDSHTVTVNTSPTATITPSGPTTFCSPGSVTLTASAGASWLWSNGATTQSIVVSASGTFSVTVTDGNGCSATSASTNVTAFPAATVTITGPTAACVNATLDAGAGFVNYLWNTGATTQTINVTTGGTYSVTVTDANGCTATDSHNIVINPAGAANITGPTEMCPTGSVTLDAGIGFASYLWNTGATTQTITVSPTGTTIYSVSVTDSNGCTGNDTHTVTVHPAPSASITPSGPTTFCAPGSVTLTANAGSSYLWSNGATTQAIVVSASGTFTVDVTDMNGCTATSPSVVVTVHPAPVVNINGLTGTCTSTPVTLDAGAGFTSYLWNTGATTQTITVNPASTATYDVTVTNASGCSATDSHTVNVSANPVATITAPATACSGSTHNASVAPQPGATYAWSITGGTFTTPPNNHTVSFTANASGTVTLDVVVTVASCTSNGNTSIPIVAPPIVTITGPTSVCPNAAFTLNAGAGFNTYLWSNGATGPSITVTQTAASQTYSVTVTDGSGCSATDSHNVSLSAAPNATITAPTSINANASGNAAVPLQPGASYVWSIVNGTIDAGQHTNAISFTAGNTGTTTLSVEVAISGCSMSSSHSIAIIGSGPQQADIFLRKTAPASVNTGANFVYALQVTNLGPSDATHINVSDPLPAGTTFVSIIDGTFNCAPFGSTIQCNGSLLSGASKNINITVTAPQQPVTITNTATASGDLLDPNSNNNTASATTTVSAAPANCSTTPPSLLTPAPNANVNSPVTFSWTAVTGAVEYELWLASPQTTWLAATTNATNATLPLAAGDFGWFVIARFSGDCAPLTSARRDFEVLPLGDCSTHVAPQLTSPSAGSTTNSPVTFSWTPVPQAIGYRVWIEVANGGMQDVGTTDGAITLTADVPPGAITAVVDALFNGCPDTRSAPLAFNVARPDPCANRSTVTLLAPANHSTHSSSVIDFDWTDANADGYRVWASIHGGAPEVIGITDESSLQATIAHGVVDWWVELLYEGCASTNSQHARVTVPLHDNCTTTAPQLLSPPNGSTVSNANVTFSWTIVPSAIRYEVWLSANGATPTLIGTTSSSTLTHAVPGGTLQWFVRAIHDGCPSSDSQRATFTWTPPAMCLTAQPPVAIAPPHGAQASSPVDFEWTAIAGATSYDLFVVRGRTAPQFVLSTSNHFANDVALANGNIRWFVRAHFDACPSLDSADQQLEIVATPAACSELLPPSIFAAGQISSGVPFLVQWNEIPGATIYQLHVASVSSFEDAELITTSETKHSLTRTNTGTQLQPVYVRVRALDTRCEPATVTPYGPTAAIFILPHSGTEGSTPVTGGIVTNTIDLGSELAGQSFVVTVKEPWITVTPSSGVVPAGGTHLLVTADTTGLPVGTSLGGVQITLTSSSANGIGTNATTVKFPTLTISKVTPVTPAPKSTPPPDALIIPAVAHANGINSQFQSDVRVTNSSAELLQYELTFTPTGSEGLAAGRKTTFSIEPGRTMALDDILKGWFGTGGESVTGTVEIRPVTQTAPSTSSLPFTGLPDLVTFASSRTFNVTSNGTFGQYIPAIPFANFIGGASELVPAPILSLQQIAQSDRYRTNLGIVEGSGAPASLLVKIFGSDGQKLKEFPVELAGGQHTQLNAFLSTQGVGPLADGRVEISVIGGLGKVTAYASVLDAQTSDPLLVTPVTLGSTGNTKWVVPGVADLNNGIANWQTDMRLFNAGAADVDTTLTFYSQNGGEPKVANVTIPAGQVKQFDRSLASIFGVANDGGAIHVSTAEPSRLVATARTYNQTTNGTFGQFISGVTPQESTGVGSRPLQILQVEETNRFRSNIGLAETTGKPVKIELRVTPPDAKVSIVTELTLQANEFRQIGSMLRSVGLGETYNARVSVRAIEGEGRVTAYASVIDMITNDPTLIPAQ